MENSPRFTNRLARETSPYLLQHAHNPVDWFPWGEEAFAKARAEDKPIFLSVGYSTCHWCHVMERESFENESIAALLNAHFVSIKVDREERPDVDRVYMAFVQAANGSGGWPMNVFLTPTLEPFSGGTYFPPADRGRSPGFPRVLNHLAHLWQSERAKVLAHGAETLEMLRAYTSGAAPEEDAALHAGLMDVAFTQLVQSFDEEWGGFGSAPKFPRPATIHFLLRQFARTGSEQARQLALVTLDKMAAGGLHDHLGGGFHRYSVDREWHVPHFEKMLYDQAQLAMAYLEAFQLTGTPRYERITRGILDYVLRDLQDREGGFHSAEDADSLPQRDAREKVEGAFYVWEQGELESILNSGAASEFGRYYGVEPNGNAVDDPHGEFIGKNILIERAPDEAVSAQLTEARVRLFAVRSKRPRPHLDDKVLTAWNALAISAFARASAVLDEPRYLIAAQRAAHFIEARMLDEHDILRRSFREGVVADIAGFADDYAFFIQALLDLYAADFDPHWLELAARLQRTMDARFADPHDGYFSTSGADASVLLRVKEDYDGAEPAPSSVAALNLQRLGILFDDADWQTRAEQTLRAFMPQLQRVPHALPQMLCALDYALAPHQQIVIAGDPAAPATRELLATVRRPFLPHQTLLLADAGASQNFLAQTLPYLATASPVQGQPAAYLCENQTCQLPITNSAELADLLRVKSSRLSPA